MKRPRGTGHLYVNWGTYYGRWRTADGRLRNRSIGKVRARGSADGLTRAQAERALQRLIELEATRPLAPAAERPRTVDDLVDALRERLEIEGARLSYAVEGTPRDLDRNPRRAFGTGFFRHLRSDARPRPLPPISRTKLHRSV